MGCGSEQSLWGPPALFLKLTLCLRTVGTNVSDEVSCGRQGWVPERSLKVHRVSPVPPRRRRRLPCETKGGSLPRSVPLCASSQGHPGPLPLAQSKPQNRHGAGGEATPPVTKPGPKGQAQRHSRRWGLQRGLLGPDPPAPAFALDPHWAQAQRGAAQCLRHLSLFPLTKQIFPISPE